MYMHEGRDGAGLLQGAFSHAAPGRLHQRDSHWRGGIGGLEKHRSSCIGNCLIHRKGCERSAPEGEGTGGTGRGGGGGAKE